MRESVGITTMRFGISPEEWWPVLMLDPEEESIYDAKEIPDSLVSRYRSALDEWSAVQSELRKLNE